ncbi:MAG: ribonuclease HII [Treponema sp.]|jgi:ribonuclease HII|nr:ribonuclease HII [Treponema sp.]
MLCGIDEAGRGPLAGPVCAAAVILGDVFPRNILNDSKKMSAARREEARRIICAGALAWGVAWAGHKEIDEINILQASLLAMKRAFEQLAGAGKAAWPFEMSGEISFGSSLLPLPLPSDLSAVVDGLYSPDIPIPCVPMVKADARVPEVMAASILAKTARDMLMDHYARLYPAYGYEKHRGYPTRDHRERILKFGPSPIQRMSFKVR